MDVELRPSTEQTAVQSPVPDAQSAAPAHTKAGRPKPTTPADTIYGHLENRRFIYIRVGYDKRVISLGAGGMVVEGVGGLERNWWVNQDGDTVVLGIGPEPQQAICSLILDKGGIWRGKWADHERMDIELVEIPA